MRVKGGWIAVGLASAAAAGGCGSETTDVSQGVASLNKDLEGTNAQLDCPKEVDGAEGTVFRCTLTNRRNGDSTRLRLKVTKEGDELLVAPVSDREVQRALEKVGAA